MAVLIGGSDLFSGMRGLSKGTKIISQEITSLFDKILTINYNYFLDFGVALDKAFKAIEEEHPDALVLYGYSKGGHVLLQLARMLENRITIDLLITIDIANGPWSHKINRNLPGNVKRNINVYQSTPSFPLGSYGLPNYSNGNVAIDNIDLTRKTISDREVNHSNIEMLVLDDVIEWIKMA